MGIEMAPLRLRPHNAADVPSEFRDLHALVTQGFSLSQIAQSLKLSAKNGRFLHLSRYLIFLADQGWLLDRATCRLTDSLRADHVWPESLVFEEIWGFELFRLRRNMVYGAEKMLTVANVLIIGGYGVYQMLQSSRVNFTSGANVSSAASESSWHWILIFIIVFALGRSLKTFAQILVMRLMTGFPASLRLRFDQVSVCLATDDLSLSRGGESALWGGLGSLLWLTLPLVLFARSPDLPIAIVFLQLMLLADLSPFVRSGLTDWMRLLYNFIATPDRGDVESERLFRQVHIVVQIIWAIAFLSFVALTCANAFSHLASHLSFSGLSDKIGTLLLGLIFGFIGISLLNDFFTAMVTDDVETWRLSRVWRRKPARLSVDEAIAQGRTPVRSELAKLPLLRQLETSLRDELLSKARVIELKPGEFACRQGRADRSLFIVLSGEVAVAKSVKGRRRVVALLESGAIFGEAAFFLGQTRTADVIAIEACQVLEIAHHPSMRALDQDRSSELRSRIWFLQALVSSPGFRSLPSEALDALIFAGRETRVLAGAQLVREGEDANACYFIVQGQGTVLQNGRVINKVKAGDVVGEIALLKPFIPRTATVMADSEMITFAVSAEDFWALLGSHIPLAIEIERMAESRLLSDRHKKSSQPTR